MTLYLGPFKWQPFDVAKCGQKAGKSFGFPCQHVIPRDLLGGSGVLGSQTGALEVFAGFAKLLLGGWFQPGWATFKQRDLAFRETSFWRWLERKGLI